ncbi:hypothetical protein AB6809_29510 [Paraburkholderia sp. RCC_158]|uniref:hypothetical protein n=1 Tax=Paraburkholderia sp. RCC_158 TaxID=3239220 RepID=UPI00352622FC
MIKAYAMLLDATGYADAKENHGNGYTLRVHLRGGRMIQGAVVRFDDRMLRLAVWEGDNDGVMQPTDVTAFIDVTEIAAVEVCW